MSIPIFFFLVEFAWFFSLATIYTYLLHLVLANKNALQFHISAEDMRNAGVR